MKYRKKPVVVEAVQWTGDNPDEMCAFWRDSENKPHIVESTNGDGTMEIEVNTLEGLMVARPGNWIIKGIKGEFYPCKSDIFEATYEAVEERPYTIPDLEVGKMYNSPTHGVVEFKGMDNYMGDVTCKFYSHTYRDTCYWYEARLAQHLEPLRG